jgi:uncharacterized delta-60 repeat protein
MRAALVALIAVSSLAAASASAVHPTPRLDARFARRGVAALRAARGPYPSDAWLRSVALTPLSDGRFAMLLLDVPPGRSTWTSSARSLVAVVGPDGALDRSFGQDGTFDVSAIGTMFQIAADPQGRLLLAGNTAEKFESPTSTARSATALVVRLSRDGRLDEPFDPTGALHAAYSPPADSTARVALIRAASAGASEYALVLNANAVVHVDESGGWTQPFYSDLAELRSVPPAPPQAAVRGFAADSQGRAVLLEERYAPDAGGASTFVVVRLDAAGSKDATFGRGGVVVLDATPLREHAFAVDDADRVVVVCDGAPWRVIRLLPDGTRDPSWGDAGDGVRELAVAGGDPGAIAVAVEDGRCFVAGIARTGRSWRRTAFVARFTAAGGAAPDVWRSSPRRFRDVVALDAVLARNGAAWIGFDVSPTRGRRAEPALGRVLFE